MLCESKWANIFRVFGYGFESGFNFFWVSDTRLKTVLIFPGLHGFSTRVQIYFNSVVIVVDISKSTFERVIS